MKQSFFDEQFINEQISKKENYIDTNKISDGFHSFGELYEFRKVFNAVLFNDWASKNINSVHKSKRHNDGELCFGGGWFIVCAKVFGGQISFHYPLSDWDLFKCLDTEKAIYPFDGHTPNDVLERLKQIA